MGKQIIRKIVISGLALVLPALMAGTANARFLDLQVQTRYDLLQVKDKDGEVKGDGHFHTSYNLLLRRPVLPSVGLVSDLTFNSTSTAEQGNGQNNKNWEFSLHSRQPTYNFTGRITRNDYTRTSILSGGSSSGNNTNYSTNLLLKQPAWPVVNIQYSRNTSDNSFGDLKTNQSTNTWLLGGYYDLEPLHFTYDRVRQSYNYSGTASGGSTLSQRSSVLLNHTLMQGLTLSGELSKSAFDTEFAGGRSSTETDRKLIRLSMTPTPAVVANIDYSNDSNVHERASGLNRNKGKTLMYSVRSQVLPGVSLDYSRQHQRQDGGLSSPASKSINQDLGFGARLSSKSFLNGSVSQSEYAVDSTGSRTKQNNMQLGFQTNITPTADLNINYGQNKSKGSSADEYNGSFAGISFRNRSSNRLSTGVTYRWSKIDTLLQDSASQTQTTHGLDIDALWMPSYDLGIDFRLSYQANNGSSISQSLAPAVNVRWQLDPSTNLNVNYSFQNSDQWDWADGMKIGQNTKDLSFYMTHRFKDGSSFNLSYDFQRNNYGSIEWERQLRAYFVTRL